MKSGTEKKNDLSSLLSYMYWSKKPQWNACFQWSCPWWSGDDVQSTSWSHGNSCEDWQAIWRVSLYTAPSNAVQLIFSYLLPTRYQWLGGECKVYVPILMLDTLVWYITAPGTHWKLEAQAWKYTMYSSILAILIFALGFIMNPLWKELMPQKIALTRPDPYIGLGLATISLESPPLKPIVNLPLLTLQVNLNHPDNIYHIFPKYSTPYVNNRLGLWNAVKLVLRTSRQIFDSR